jgi:GNAT superfamily N-acetyltransferase
VEENDRVTAVEAIENNLYAYPLFHAWSRAESYDGPDLLWALSDIRIPMFNRLGRANLREDRADAAIDAAVTRARAKHVPLQWWVGPSSRPLDLGERLRARGFVHTRDLRGMAAHLDSKRTQSHAVQAVQIERVRDREMLRVWNGVPQLSDERYAFYAEHLGSSFRHYIGHAGGAPVATGSLFLGGGAAGIYNIHTKREMRGRGIGAALTAVAMNDARELGYASAVLLANAQSAVLYARLGFVEDCRVGNYLWTGAG